MKTDRFTYYMCPVCKVAIGFSGPVTGTGCVGAIELTDPRRHPVRSMKQVEGTK